MRAITTIGLDIAKSIFQVHGVGAEGQILVRRQLRRALVLTFFKELPPCLVGIEACASSGIEDNVQSISMTKAACDPLYRRHRFPPAVIAHAVWLYFRFPLRLRMVEDLLATRGIAVSHQSVRLWAEKFGRSFANIIRRRAAGQFGDKWHLDEIVVTIGGRNVESGALLINKASFSMFLFKAAVTPRPQSV